MTEPGFKPTHRHVRSGGAYEILGSAHIQTTRALADMAEVIVYRGADGRLWARDKDEFHDGRFEEV